MYTMSASVSVSADGETLSRDVCRYSQDMTFSATLPRTLRAHDGVLRVFCDDNGAVLRFPMTEKPLAGDFFTDRFSVSLPAKKLCTDGADSALVFYRFEFDTVRGHCYLAKAAEGLFPVLRYEDKEIHAFQLTVTEDSYRIPDNIFGGIMYHIFVDRFYRGDDVLSGKRRIPVRADAVFNDDWDNGIPQHAKMPGGTVENNEFFGGTLWGVLDKLPYLASLGVDILYLSPIFEAYSNHKYDTGDYETVDAMFGGEEAFSALLQKAKEMGIRVICDGVFNHTGSDSRYFNRAGRYETLGAYQSEKSPYYPWYRFKDYPDEYDCWWGVKVLPAVSSGDPDFRHYICSPEGILHKWMQLGVSGWRLDVADELDDRFLCDLRTRVKAENPDAVIFGEVWEDASNKISYGRRRQYFRGEQLDSVMNYPFRDGILSYLRTGDAAPLADTVEEILRHYPAGCAASLMNLIGTHDTERALTVLGCDLPDESVDNDTLAAIRMTAEEREKGKSLLKLAALLQFTLPGIPCIYYGDEAGMEGFRDPFNRRPYPWGREDSELLSYYRKLGTVRKAHRTLFAGDNYTLLYAKNGVFLFRRGDAAEGLLICVNRGTEEFRISGAYSELLHGIRYENGTSVLPEQGMILKVLDSEEKDGKINLPLMRKERS